MAAWFSVYCTRSVAGVSAADILAGIRDADFWTIAEDFGIEDGEAVRSALDALRIEPVTDQPDIQFRLSYRPPEFRPVLVHVWTAPERVRTELEEAAERLEDATGEGVGRIQAHFGRVVEVVAVELGWSQMSDMGVVLANQVAEFLAGIADGIVLDENDAWWAVESGVLVKLAG